MDHSFLQGNDFVGITFWIVSIGMWAATLFFFYEGMRVSAKWRTSIVVINKIDKPGARPDWVMDQVFDLFDNLGATDEQLDFQVVYASALNGWASLDADAPTDDMTPLFQTIVDQVAAPDADVNGGFQMQISQLDYNSYVGVIGVGRVSRGSVKPNQQVTVVTADGKHVTEKWA